MGRGRGRDLVESARSLSSFNDFALRPSSRKALEQMRIDTPTSIQERTIPAMLGGKDVIAQAPTGSGKTLAFALPILEKIEAEGRRTQALILVPTRELARQVGSVFHDLSRGSHVRVTMVYGGVGYGQQDQDLRAGAHVVVGTPGRILDHLERLTMRLDGIRMLVLDEADEMLDRGFGPDVERILKHTPRERQTALFSATTPEWVHKISTRYLRHPEVIESAAAVEMEPDITHKVMEVHRNDKFEVLVKLLREPGQGSTLVFGRTKRGVKTLGRRLERHGFRVAILQGNLSQNQRDQAVASFRSGKTNVLVATNVAARGLDILHITRVINYEMPDTHELFTHRVGRTGRMGRSGEAVTLVGPEEMSTLHEIERGLGKKLPRMKGPATEGRPHHAPAPAPVAVAPSHPHRPSQSQWGGRRRRRR